MSNYHELIKSIEGRPLGNLSLDEHFLRSPRPDVFFLFVEKVGCTLLKSILLQEMIGDCSHIDPEYYLQGWSRRNVIHTLCHEVLRVDGRRVLSDPAAKVITFCRNPYARFISAYVDKIVNPPPTEIDHFRWVRREILFWHLRQSDRLGRLNDTNRHVSLGDFARYVASTNPADRDKHWAEQHLINLVDVVRPTVLVRLEDFDATFRKVWAQQVGTELRMFPDADRNDATRPRPLLDETTASLIYTIYARDFELLGYHRDSWREFSAATARGGRDS